MAEWGNPAPPPPLVFIRAVLRAAITLPSNFYISALTFVFSSNAYILSSDGFSLSPNVHGFAKRLCSFARRRFAFAKRSCFRYTLIFFQPTAFRFCQALAFSLNLRFNRTFTPESARPFRPLWARLPFCPCRSFYNRISRARPLSYPKASSGADRSQA